MSCNMVDLLKLNTTQLRNARLARQIMRNLGYKSNESVRHLIQKKYLVGCPVDSRVFKQVDELIGLDPNVVAGKTRRKRDRRLRLFRKLALDELVLEIDIMFLWSHAFLIAVTQPMSHVSVYHLGALSDQQVFKDTANLIQAIETIINFYKSRRWLVRFIIFDGERGLSSREFMNHIRAMSVEPIPLASGRHANRAERKIGYLKARARTVKKGLPFSLPPSVVPALVEGVRILINADCSKSNEDRCPPQVKIDRGAPIEYNHTHAAAFGDYCQVVLDTTSSAKATGNMKTVDAIALYPSESKGQGFWFWVPETNSRLCRQHFVQHEIYSEKILRDIHQVYLRSIKLSAKVLKSSGDLSTLDELRVDQNSPGIALSLDRERLPAEIYNFACFENNDSESVFMVYRDPDLLESQCVENIFANIADTVEYQALLFATQYSLKKGVILFGDECTKVVREELTGIIEREVMEGVKFDHLSREQKDRLLRAKMIISEKFKDGIFERLKARLVALGNLQDRSEYEKKELSSPTPSHTVVLMQIALAAMQGKTCISFDIGQAFLNAQMSDRDVHIRLNREIAEIMVGIDERYREFLCKNGEMIVRLNRALYGIVEAPKLWYDTLSAFLMSNGFKRSELDLCYFYKHAENGELIDLSVHVDDGLMTSTAADEMRGIIDKLRDQFKIVKVHEGTSHFHLGMQIDFKKDGTAHISMSAKTTDIVEVWNVGNKTSSTPHDENLFKIEIDSPKLNDAEREKFHSSVQSCLYLSVKARPDITCAVNFLTTRVREPTADDLKKLIKVIKYLNGTIEYAIRLGGDSDGKVKIYAFADASYGVHPDGKSHTGIFITLGCGPLMWKSIKQKCVTRSSFEAEIIALSDIVSLSIWIRDMLREIGEIDHDEPVIIMEDNKAAITVLKNGASTSDRAKHIHIRNCFIQQFIESGEFVMKHCPTKEMVADIFTKPLFCRLYCYLRDYLLGYKRSSIT